MQCIMGWHGTVQYSSTFPATATAPRRVTVHLQSCIVSKQYIIDSASTAQTLYIGPVLRGSIRHHLCAHIDCLPRLAGDVLLCLSRATSTLHHLAIPHMECAVHMCVCSCASPSRSPCFPPRASLWSPLFSSPLLSSSLLFSSLLVSSPLPFRASAITVIGFGFSGIDSLNQPTCARDSAPGSSLVSAPFRCARSLLPSSREDQPCARKYTQEPAEASAYGMSVAAIAGRVVNGPRLERLGCWM